MTGSDNRSQPDPDRREETPNPEVDRKPEAQQRQSGESAYRYYRRRITRKLRQITHEQHLAYGTWGLAIATWILALLAYCALRDNQDISSQSQRAWVGPNQASSATTLTPDMVLDVVVQYQNTGRAPAFDVTKKIEQMSVTLEEEQDGRAQKKIDNVLRDCIATPIESGQSVVYPATGFNSYNLAVSFDKRDIDWDVAYGLKSLVIEGCFVYRTLKEIHRSAFCYFYRAGINKDNAWAFCNVGNYAN